MSKSNKTEPKDTPYQSDKCPCCQHDAGNSAISHIIESQHFDGKQLLRCQMCGCSWWPHTRNKP